MNKETKERIEKDARDYIHQIHAYVNGFEYEGYIAGATSEHPKAWNDAVNKCISAIVNDEDILMNGSRLIEKLEALKL